MATGNFLEFVMFGFGMMVFDRTDQFTGWTWRLTGLGTEFLGIYGC